MKPILWVVVLGVLHLLTMASASAGLRGDMNNDGLLDGRDVQRFVEVLVSPADALFEERCAADTSEDLLISVDDIQPMVSLLLGLVPPQYSVQGHWDRRSGRRSTPVRRSCRPQCASEPRPCVSV